MSVSTEPSCRWCAYVNRRLDAIRDERDWSHLNDFGSSWPSTWLIERARSEITALLRPTTPSPSVLPGDDDGPAIQFVWHKNNWDLTLTVDPDDVTIWAHPYQDHNKDNLLYGPLDALHRQALGRILDDLEATP